jgi:translation initiation factor eIF-2B subunit delta
MATETGGPAAAGPASESKPAQEKSAKNTPKEQQPSKGDAGEKKLSNAELKKKAKEEKAARRAQAKASGAGPGPGAQGAADGKGGKGKQKQDGPQGQQQQSRPATRPAAPVPTIPKEVKPTIPECFSHLSVARRIDMTQADKDVHPAVLALGQHMSTFALSDSITRLEATLLAFKKVRNLVIMHKYLS